MRTKTFPRLLPALSPTPPEAPELPRPLWEALLAAPNSGLSRESCALR